MDIDSKKWNIRSNGFGGFTITNRKTNETRTVQQAPSAHALAMMSENQFDKEMQRLFNES